jgi:oligosaccharyltransferase complex subunit alpha (ribophorin I)
MRSLSSLPYLLASAAAVTAAPAQNFVNTAIARTVELGGSITQITTQYNVKSLEDGPGEYHLALAGEDDAIPAWWEVLVGGEAVKTLDHAEYE